MNEHRKNPSRRPPTSGERRPGLRQLPKDFDDLASGRTERLRRPRKAPAPLHDEREGAVIAGVRNMEARAVYDARVRALRQQLADGRHSELQAGLEAARQMRLWRARNVTDFQAFVESVIGLSPEQAAELSVSDQPDAPHLPDHVVALAVRVEAALLAHAKSATVTLRVDAAGELKLSMELPAADVHRAVDAVEDAGRAVSGLRYFLRDEERPRFGDRDAAAGGGERRPARERRDDLRSERWERDAAERRLPRRERDQAPALEDADYAIERAVAGTGEDNARDPVGGRSELRARDDSDDEEAGERDQDDSAQSRRSADAVADDAPTSTDDESNDEESMYDGQSSGDDADDHASDDDGDVEAVSERSEDDVEEDASDDESDDLDDEATAVERSEPDGDESDDSDPDFDEQGRDDVAAAGGDAGERPVAPGRTNESSREGVGSDAGDRPFGRRREGSPFSRDRDAGARGAGRGGFERRGTDDRDNSGRGGFDRRGPGDRDARSGGFGRAREQGGFDKRSAGDRDAGPRGFGRGGYDKRGADDRDAGPRGFGRSREQGGFDRRGPDDRATGGRGFSRGQAGNAFDRRGPDPRDAGQRGFGRGGFDKRGTDDRDAGQRGFGRGGFDKRGTDDRDAGPRFGGGRDRDAGPGRFGRDRVQAGGGKRDAGPRRYDDRQTGTRDFGRGREQGGFDDRSAGSRFGRGADDRNAGSRFERGPQRGFDKRETDDRGPKSKSFGKPKKGGGRGPGPKKHRK